MKKNKLNRLLKFGILLFGVSLFIVACQKDDDFKTQEVSEIDVKRVTLKELQQNTRLEKSLKSISKHLDVNKSKTDNNAKVDANDGSFTILTDEILQLTKDYAETYTFRVETPTHPQSVFENFVIEKSNDSTYAFFIYRYRENNLDQSLDLDYLMSREEIDESEIDILLFNDYINNKAFYDEDTDCLYSLEEVENCECEVLTVLACNIFNPIDYGSPGGSSTGSSSTGGSTTSGDTNNGGTSNTGSSSSTSTVAILPCRGDDCPQEFDPIHDKNCEELGKLINNPATTAPQNNPFITGENKSTRIAIINLPSDISSNFEHGFSFINNGDFQNHGPYAHHLNAQQEDHIKPPRTPRQYGVAHSHPNPQNTTRIPMFSHDDIISLLTIRNNYIIPELIEANTNGDALFVQVVAVRQGGQDYVYALKIEDVTKMQQLQTIKDDYNDANGDGTNLYNDFKDEVDDYYKNKKDESAAFYQKNLLKLIKDKDLGISLYKMKPNDLSNPDELETWEKLSLKTDGTLANPKPCN